MSMLEGLKLIIPGTETLAILGAVSAVRKIRPLCRMIRNMFWDREGNSGTFGHIDDNPRIRGFGHCPPFRKTEKDRTNVSV